MWGEEEGATGRVARLPSPLAGPVGIVGLYSKRASSASSRPLPLPAAARNALAGSARR